MLVEFIEYLETPPQALDKMAGLVKHLRISSLSQDIAHQLIVEFLVLAQDVLPFLLRHLPIYVNILQILLTHNLIVFSPQFVREWPVHFPRIYQFLIC